jgi:hypothetical protein
MTLAWLEGFDYYPLVNDTPGIGLRSTWIGADGGHTLIPGRFAPGKALQCYQHVNNSRAQRLLPESTIVTLGFAIRVYELNTLLVGGNRLIEFISADNQQVQFAWGANSLGRMYFERGGVKLGLTDKSLLQNTWHFIEIELILSDAAGRATMWLDGELIQEFTGIDTKGAADPTIGSIAPALGGNGELAYALDDMYLLTGVAAAVGESRIEILAATANDTVEFDPSAGTNWSNISDLPPDADSSYNSSNTVGAVDLFTMGDIISNPTGITAIEIISASRKDDAGTRTMRNVIKSGAVTANGEDQNLVVDYRWNRDVFNLNPDGDVPWTKAAINALSVGYELRL